MKSEILLIVLSSHRTISEGNSRVNVNSILNFKCACLYLINFHCWTFANTLMRCQCEGKKYNMSCTKDWHLKVWIFNLSILWWIWYPEAPREGLLNLDIKQTEVWMLDHNVKHTALVIILIGSYYWSSFCCLIMIG